MINFPAVFIANGAAIALMLVIMISSHRTTRYSLLDEKIYYAMVVMTLLQCVIESATYMIDGQVLSGYHTLSYILNSALYVINISFAFSWTVYADYKLFEDRQRLKKIYKYVAIPAVLIILGALMNFVIPVFYTISDQNVYERTTLYVIPYIFTYIYLMYGVVLIYAYRNRAKKYLFLPAIIFMVPIAIGSLIQLFCYGYSLIWIGVAIAMVSLYINVQNEASYVDALSGLFTRQYLYNYLYTQTKKKDVTKNLVGVMLDIDQFKSINDQYGHQIGDQAIASAGRILHSVVETNGLAARYAGDEFIIIQYLKSEEEIQKILQSIEKRTEEFNKSNKDLYQLHFSMGDATYRYGNDSVDNFLKRMDMKMYEQKNEKIRLRKLPERRLER